MAGKRGSTPPFYFKRFIAIILLFTTIVTFTFKPKKSDAFALSIIGVGGATIAIGATILLALGFSATNEAQQKYEARQLMEKYGKDIELEFKPLLGSATWIDYATAVDSAIWEQFTGRFRLKEGAHEDFSEHMKTVPITGTGTYRKEITTFENGYGGTYDGQKYYYDILPGNTDKYIVLTYSSTSSFSSVNIPISIKNDNKYIQFYGIPTDVNFYDEVRGTSDATTMYSFNREWVKWDTSKVKFYVGESFSYNPTNTEGVSKDVIAERLPVSDTVDLSNTTSLPLSLEKDKTLTDIPGLTVEKAPATDIPLTGWGWLDGILGKILGGILGIPVSVLAGLRVLWKELIDSLTDIKDYIISLPVSIADSIADVISDVFVPTLSLDDTIAKMKDKISLPSFNFPSISEKKPLSFKFKFANYSIDIVLDQSYWSVIREIILGFLVISGIAFAYRKISSVGGGDE